MSSDTDTSISTASDSSSSSVEYKKRKSSKKHKRKTEKKHKKQKSKRDKEKKRLKKNSKMAIHQPVTLEVTQDSFGPALPPHLVQKSEAQTTTTSGIIGPILPTELLKPDNNQTIENAVKLSELESDEDIGYGPMPLDKEMNATQIEREQRALELRIAALEGRSLNPNATDQKSREEWMLELPDVGLRGGLAALSNMKRTFHTGKEKPDFSDRSAWTKTPQSESNVQNPLKPKQSGESIKSEAEALYERKRDAEQERLAKKHKRNESLMELHKKKLRKEQKQKEKELAASGSKPERRPFSRDVDLKLNKIDKHQTKQIVDKAKILNSKFSSGKTKYL